MNGFKENPLGINLGDSNSQMDMPQEKPTLSTEAQAYLDKYGGDLEQAAIDASYNNEPFSSELRTAQARQSGHGPKREHGNPYIEHNRRVGYPSGKIG